MFLFSIMILFTFSVVFSSENPMKCMKLFKTMLEEQRFSVEKFKNFKDKEKNMILTYKVLGMLSTDCKNQSLRDRVDYKFDCRLQSSEFREPDFFL